MANISTIDARGIFTKTLIAIYKEKSMPTAFLRSFFPSVESNSKEISIEVQRGFEMIAVDVERGTEGNRNSFSKATEKIIIPPYYREYFDATELDFYDRLFTESGVVDEITFNDWITTVVEKLMLLQYKIERSYELQCSQVLTTGIVTLVNGTNIDFKRKAASLVDKTAGYYWATSTIDPDEDSCNACTFIRTKGKSQGGVYNAIFGESAFTAYMNNAVIKARQGLYNIDLGMIRQPQRDATGGVLHGQISAGPYKLNMWSYPEYYDASSTSLNNPYLNSKKVIVVPEAPKFKLAFAAVPQLLGNKANVGAGLSGKRGAYLVGEFLDERNSSHIVDIKSAGIAVPVAVDQIYTVQVVA